jgi:hypothetical protein
VEALDTEAQSKNSVPRAIEGGAESLMIQVSVVESPASDVCRGESEESEHDTNTGMELGHDDGFGIQSPVFKLQPLRRVAQANEQVTLQRPQTVHAGGACKVLSFVTCILRNLYSQVCFGMTARCDLYGCPTWTIKTLPSRSGVHHRRPSWPIL